MKHLTLRLPPELHAGLERYCVSAKLSASDAVRNMISDGIRGVVPPSINVGQTLSDLRATIEEMATQVGEMSANITESSVAVSELVSLQQTVSEHSKQQLETTDELHVYARPLLEIVCEIYVISRLLVKKNHPEEHPKLPDYKRAQLEMFLEYVGKQVGSKEGQA